MVVVVVEKIEEVVAVEDVMEEVVEALSLVI